MAPPDRSAAREDYYPSRLLERVVLRLPDGMRAQIMSAAKANRRSANAEYVARLEATLRDPTDPGDDMAPRVPSRGTDQFNLRLPDGMRDEIAERAEGAGRSMNTEIVVALQAWLAGPTTAPASRDENGNLRSWAPVLRHMRAAIELMEADQADT